MSIATIILLLIVVVGLEVGPTTGEKGWSTGSKPSPVAKRSHDLAATPGEKFATARNRRVPRGCD